MWTSFVLLDKSYVYRAIALIRRSAHVAVVEMSNQASESPIAFWEMETYRFLNGELLVLSSVARSCSLSDEA